MIKRMGKFDWCAVIEKQWCNLWKRQNVLSLQLALVSLASRVSVLGKAVLGLEFFLCPWPRPRALCPRSTSGHQLWRVKRSALRLRLTGLVVMVVQPMSCFVCGYFFC